MLEPVTWLWWGFSNQQPEIPQNVIYLSNPRKTWRQTNGQSIIVQDISYAGASATQTRRKERGKSSATDPTSSAEPDHNSSSNRGEKKAEYIKLNFPVLGTIDKALLPEGVYPILRKGNLVKFCRVWAKLTSYWVRRLIRGPPALSLSKCT